MSSLDPQNLVHFIGIGGVGMSALAEVLHQKGYRVQGSDQSVGKMVEHLQQQGIKVFVGHKAGQVEKAGLVVISTAIGPDNVELQAAQEKGIEVIHRAEMLAQLLSLSKNICITGTHGKTTTTALTYALLKAGGLAPGVLNGGVIVELGSNAEVGNGEWVVAEADESDGSFNRLHPDIAVVTNIEPEHMETFGNMDDVLQAYIDFIHNTPQEDGLVVLGMDDPLVAQVFPKVQRRVVTFGFDEKANIRALNIQQQGYRTSFDLSINGEQKISMAVNLPGQHNVLNALAACAVAFELGVQEEGIGKALAAFKGVGRRFNLLGHVEGMAVVDDYAHHPTEIHATLAAAKKTFSGKILAVIQPHRYSRLRDLMEEFAVSAEQGDEIIIAPVYAAGEKPLAGITHETLAEKIRNRGRKVDVIKNEAELLHRVKQVHNSWQEGEHAVICMGAGSITRWAQHLVAAVS